MKRRVRRVKKRASLSLSINAIVVLVLAITMLGLGLGFTKGMFGKFSSKLTVPEPDIPATALEKIVLPSDTITIQKNKGAIFSVNVYNDEWDSSTLIKGSLKCGTGGLSADATGQAIPIGEDAGFKIVIDKEKTKKSGTNVCTLSFTDGKTPVSKQIVMAIK